MSELINQKRVTVKSPILQSNKVSFCHTCKAPIYDLPYRFLVVNDYKNKHQMISFHYFFPCWDIEYVCKNLNDYEIFKAGFCCDKSLLRDPRSINNFRKNPELWDIEVSI